MGLFWDEDRSPESQSPRSLWQAAVGLGREPMSSGHREESGQWVRWEPPRHRPQTLLTSLGVAQGWVGLKLGHDVLLPGCGKLGTL